MHINDKIVVGFIISISLLATVGAGYSLYRTYGEMNLLYLLLSISSGGMIGLIGGATFQKLITLQKN